MREAQLESARRQAEQAVADMPPGDLQTKAFEVILAHLLGSTPVQQAPAPVKHSGKPRTNTGSHNPSNSCTARIRLLKEEGFFAQQRTIREVKDELARHGWHYPATALSGKLQTLVQKRELRRIKVKEGKRDIWKYSLP